MSSNRIIGRDQSGSPTTSADTRIRDEEIARLRHQEITELLKAIQRSTTQLLEQIRDELRRQR